MMEKAARMGGGYHVTGKTCTTGAGPTQGVTRADATRHGIATNIQNSSATVMQTTYSGGKTVDS